MQSGHFKGLAHVEWELPMVETLRNRLVAKWGETATSAAEKVILFDIQRTEELLNGDWSDETKQLYKKENTTKILKGLRNVIDKDNVDIIIGGPHVKHIRSMAVPLIRTLCKMTIEIIYLKVL